MAAIEPGTTTSNAWTTGAAAFVVILGVIAKKFLEWDISEMKDALVIFLVWLAGFLAPAKVEPRRDIGLTEEQREAVRSFIFELKTKEMEDAVASVPAKDP